MSGALEVEFLTREGCSLCEQVRPAVEAWASRLGATLVERRLDESPELEALYGWEIPVLRTTDGRLLLKGRFGTAALVWALLLARLA